MRPIYALKWKCVISFENFKKKYHIINQVCKLLDITMKENVYIKALGYYY